MLSKIYNFLLAQAPQPSDEGPLDAIKKLWPILAIVALSALSGFFKRKKDKSKTPTLKSKTPTMAPPRIQHPKLPSYARIATQAGQPQPTPTRPVSPGKTPTLTPRPVIQKPPSPTRLPHRPTPQKPRPTPQPAPPISPQARPAPTYAAPRPTAAPAKKRPFPKKHITPAQAAAKRQMLSTAEAAKLRKTAHRSAEPASYRTPTPADPFQLAFDQHDVLVRAILYAEILDKPMALRPTGSHQF